MNSILPAAQGLRTIYHLSSERLWFALAVVAGLVIAAELVELILLQRVPIPEGFGF